MAEIQTQNHSNGKTTRRSSKKNTSVDLTPMVDLGFLLITFFVFTNTMAHPTAMNLNMPYEVEPDDHVCESCAITVLLQSQNTIAYYEGIPGVNTVVRQTDFAPGGIRNILLRKKQQVSMATGKPNEMVMIIKSADESSFQNFVDIMDEVAINNIKHYYVSPVDNMDSAIFKLKL
ncbi:MAG: biopolymer transporter ExbD [Ferruginibacter sp.]